MRIRVNGREAQVSDEGALTFDRLSEGFVSFEQIVEIWNKQHESEGVRIVGNPAIHYDSNSSCCGGILFPGEKVKVEEGMSFGVDFYV